MRSIGAGRCGLAELVVKARFARGALTFALELAVPLEGITAVFGPSGHGKTTLLRIIAGLEPGLPAEVTVDGECWQGGNVFVPPERRGVGYVFQDGRLFDDRTVAANLAYAEKRARRAAPPRARVVAALGIEGLLDRRPAGLSGGERQRVAIARALLSGPRLLLLDEPVSALDHAGRREVVAAIAAVCRQFALPAILVSHGVDEVLRLAARVALIERGRITGIGAPEAMLGEVDAEQALLSGRVVQADDGHGLMVVDLGGQTMLLAAREGVRAGEKLGLRVAAWEVALARGQLPPVSLQNQLAGRVTRIAPAAGPFVLVGVRLDCGQALVARVTGKSVEELGLSPGVAVTALVKSAGLDVHML